MSSNIYSKPKIVKHCGKYLVTFPDNHQEEVINLAQFCRDHKISHGNIITYGKSKGYAAKLITRLNATDMGYQKQIKENKKSNKVHDTKSFIEKANSIHGNRYDYSKVDYKNASTKVLIICPIHGEFQQTPNIHLSKHGCPKCGQEKQIASYQKSRMEKYSKTIIGDFKNIHGDRYDYSKVEYKNSYTKITIICPIHGEFQMTPGKHLNGHGCPLCSKLDMIKKNKEHFAKKYNTEWFIKESIKSHGTKYDYSKVIYNNSRTKITIICPIHGEFQQKASIHLAGHGCPKCAEHNNRHNHPFRHTKEMFITKARKVHGTKYDYSKVNYKNTSTKVTIICPIHGEFEQTPDCHIRGRGCWKCNHYTPQNIHYKNQPGILYLISAKAGTEKFCKVGVSIRSIQERFKYEPIEILDQHIFHGDNIGKLHDLEQSIIHSDIFDEDRFYPKTQFGGITECFNISSYPKILQFINENVTPSRTK